MRILKLTFIALCLATQTVTASDFTWPTIPAEQIAMTDHPLTAGAHAMVLDWEVFADDTSNRESVFKRIKIFTEEGRSQGDITIPFVRNEDEIKDLAARTVESDGRIIPFTGQVFEKTVVKSKQIRYLAKTFSFPEVQPGCILEYHYTHHSSLTHTWSPQGELPILHLDFKVKPNNRWWGFRYIWRSLPKGNDVLKNPDGTFELVMDNVSALESESYTPPEYELKPVVWLFYTIHADETADEMWQRLAKQSSESSQASLTPSSRIRDAALAAVNASDPPEVKLRKLYARVQQIRNLSFERGKTYEEYRREKLKENNKIEDVLKHGYGGGLEINRLYLAMIRSLGMEANEVFVSERDRYFFHKDLPGEWQLNSEVVEAKAGDKTWYLDPVEKFCPFGLLPWQETGVMGMRMTADGGTFINTPNPTSDQAITERKAHLRWQDGDLDGEVVIQLKGQDAWLERMYRRNEDADTQSKEIEDELKRALPNGSKVTFKRADALGGIEEPVTLTAQVHIPNVGAATGKRLAMPLNVFATQIDSAFRLEKRTYPLYFAYPYQELDEITLDTPDGFVLDRLPEAHKERTDFGRYVSSWEKTPGGVKFTRKFALDWFYFHASEYPAVRKFYYAVVNGDQDGALFQPHAKAK